MSLYHLKKKLFIPYLVFVGLFLVVFLATRYLSLTSFIISISFLLMVFFPGFLLSRIFKINYANILDGLIIYLTLGLIANLSLCFAGILTGMTILGLQVLIAVVFAILFFVSLILEITRPYQAKSIWSFKKSFIKENLIYVFLLFLVILVLATVDQLGTNFTGDPLGHLAIMRKAFEGLPMTIVNLSSAKDQIDIAYGIPIWHVFLVILAKLNRTSIFILYREITTVLTPLVFLVWYWFFRKLLPTRALAILAIFLFIFFHFEKNGYLFVRLPVPDTLAMLLLMPLCFGLALNYIFEKDSGYKDLIILSLMVTLMGLVHWTQYFYWLSAMGLFAILYIIFKFKDKDFKLVFEKIILAIFSNMVFVVPLLVFLQAKTQAISQNMQVFPTINKGSTNDRLTKFDPYFKLSYFFLPIVAVFIRKYRRMIFIFGVFLVGPIVYNFPWLYGMLRRYLSHVFVNRLYTNLGQWPYLIWAILLGFILVLIDRGLAKIYPAKKYLRYLIDGILGLFLIWMVFTQFEGGFVQNWYSFVFSKAVFNWLNTNYLWLIPLMILISLSIFILQKYYHFLSEFFQYTEYKNYSTMLLLTLIIAFFLGVQSFDNLKYYFQKEIQNWHFFTQATDPTPDFINPDKFGGMEAIEFIKEKIPAKSVFDTNTFANYTLPTLVDEYMASYSIDPAAPTKKYKDLYDFNIPIDTKLTMLKAGDIDYLVYQYQDSSATPFDSYPQYFIPVFSNDKAVIFQINKSVL